MERIREAIKLAKTQRDAGIIAVSGDRTRVEAENDAGRLHDSEPSTRSAIRTVRVNHRHLESMRIIAHRSDNPDVAAFDMLRTKILQGMDQHGWQILVVTSPTVGCGKTVTAVNLALSIARQPERSVVLVDLDLRKPMVADVLGLRLNHYLSGYIDGSIGIEDIVIHIDVAGPQLSIISNNTMMPHSSEIIVSRQIKSLFDKLKTNPSRPIIVVDMPPVLVSDDVIAFLPQADCSILTVSEGESTARDIEASDAMLSQTNFLGCVLTKSNERIDTYY